MQTVGPSCSGKTAYIKSLAEKLKSYSVTDVPQLYEKIPLESAISLWQNGHGSLPHNPLIYEISLKDRVIGLTDSEQMLILLLFSKKITFEEFAMQLDEKALKDTLMADLYDLLHDIALDLYRKTHSLTIGQVRMPFSSIDIHF